MTPLLPTSRMARSVLRTQSDERLVELARSVPTARSPAAFTSATSARGCT